MPDELDNYDNENRANVLLDEEQRILPLEHVSFDEMNLVELPFSLLTRDTGGFYEIPLSSDGKSRLACLNSSEYGLPNSLAPRVVLGLMSMWRTEYGNGVQAFVVKLRDLVVRYIYPERFKNYPPNSETLQAVERQINCVANTRIHTDRWWDKERKQRIKANISIISDVTVLDEGGPSRPRVLRVTWGSEFFRSMVHRYTKPLDALLVQKLENPLDLQLYRLLDRQLAEKSRQRYSSIVDFARYKLGMQGKRVDSGGRTASSYVAQKLTEAIHRLSSERFTVRMTIDRATVPFSVTFERLQDREPGQRHEVDDRDLAARLVREFLYHAHGVPREQKRTRIAETDRSVAIEWLDAYGLEKARWMVEHCVRMQKERHAPGILVFRGLELYEHAASGAYERYLTDKATQIERQFSEDLDRYWSIYHSKLVELFDTGVSGEELARLEREFREGVMRDRPDAPGLIVDAVVRARLHFVKCDRMNALSEVEFRKHRSLRALRDALIERHAVDLLATITESTKDEGNLPDGK